MRMRNRFDRCPRITEAGSQHCDGGFTLVEMVIAVVVILLLVGAALLAAPGIIAQSRHSACEATAGSISNAITASYAHYQNYSNANSGKLVTDQYLVTTPNPTQFTIGTPTANGVAVQFGPDCTDDFAPVLWAGQAIDGVYTFGESEDVPAQAPGAPVNLQGTVGDQSVELTWEAPADDGGSDITGYSVTYSGQLQGGFWTPFPTGCMNLGAVLTCTLTSLQRGHNYYVKVAAVNAIDQGPYSDIAGPFFMPTLPGAPVNLQGTVPDADGSIELTWQAPVSDGGSAITNYVVERTTETGWDSNVTGCTNVGSALTCTATGLTNNIDYYFKIAAVNSIGQGPDSDMGGPYTPLGECARGGQCQLLDTGPGGGTVIYVASTPFTSGSGTAKYLEAAPSVYTTSQWGCIGKNPSTPTNEIGSGKANTANMLADGCNSAVVASAYVDKGGLTDWYLPSGKEAIAICRWQNGMDLANYAYACTGNLGSSGVWLSWNETVNTAYRMNNVGAIGGESKAASRGIWPIRAFSPTH